MHIEAKVFRKIKKTIKKGGLPPFLIETNFIILVRNTLEQVHSIKESNLINTYFMYLSIDNCFKLDEIVKSFEVGYRSDIANKIKTSFPTINDFSIKINAINNSFEASSIISSNKLKKKAEKIKNEIGRYYNLVEDSNNAYVTGSFNNNEVPYVSELLDFVYLLFNECFTNFSNGFTTIEEFKDYSSKYHIIRNYLSHPGSNHVLLQHAHEVISFIRRLLNNISSDKFWFVSKLEIDKKINEFINSIEQIPLKIHNIDNINFKHHKVVCRDLELRFLDDLVFGKDESYRKSGSVVIYGYGGVGKTALTLEFVFNTIKRLFDNKNSELDFILFYSGKEELLSFSETTGKLYINEINKQFSTFNDFRSNFFTDLKIRSETELATYNGIVILDNIETISDVEKNQIYDFIKKSPRTIQYIITSRNEEPCEDKINLKEFNDKDLGKKFIDEFTETNNLNLYLDDRQKLEIVDSAKGNALIIVLSLLLLKNGNSFNEIIGDLKSVESQNLNVIVDFMYKNTLNQSVSELDTNGYKPVEILKVISLYQFPVDLYSISYLSQNSIRDVEHICTLLSSKLILEKSQESYSLNEFTSKFIFIKYFPNKLERKDLQEKIRSYRNRLSEQLNNLENIKSREPKLKNIVEDWKPKNAIDKIAIAESFTLFGETKGALRQRNKAKIETIKDDIEKNEKMTSHPYIKYQKARIYDLIRRTFPRNKEPEEILNMISKSFEDAIESADFYYPFIKNSMAYGALNLNYGVFILRIKQQPIQSLRYLEEAIEIFKKLRIKDNVYFTMIDALSEAYTASFKLTNNKKYIVEFKKMYNEFTRDKKVVIGSGFNYDKYINQFKKYNH